MRLLSSPIVLSEQNVGRTLYTGYKRVTPVVIQVAPLFTAELGGVCGDMPEDRNQTHPLYGADLKTLWHVWHQAGGGNPGRRQGRLFRAFLVAGARFPFTVAESLYVATSCAKSGPVEAPVFILGHWRSGTTHLYNVLSKAPHFAYVSPFATALPWDFLLLGNILRPLLEKQLPKHRYIDRVAVDPDSPQEDEIALANMSPVTGELLSMRQWAHVATEIFQWQTGVSG